jgi:methionyl-tRNA formyltransferase
MLSFMSYGLFKRYGSYLGNLSKNKLKIIDFNDVQRSVNFIKDQNIDLIVLSNWWLLPDEIIYAPKFKTINIHPSKLPKYRGSVPTLWALKHQDKETAVTFMVLNSVVDGGGIISQYNVSMNARDDSISLENKCDETIKKYLVRDLIKYLNKEIVPIKQNIKLGSMTPKYYEYMKIDWENELGQDIVNKVKLYPHLWPVDTCYTVYKGKKISFKKASLLSKNSSFPPGTFVVKNLKVYINCIDKIIVSRLFRDVSLKDSFILLFKRKNVFSNS